MILSAEDLSKRTLLKLERLREKHAEIYTIIAPPRSCSTALARVFWEHSEVGYYCHEPFDAVYHNNSGLETAGKALRNPLNVLPFGEEADVRGNALVVKEMTFQVGKHFRNLASAATRPLIFLLRDPRFCIASRMRHLRKGGQDPHFPLFESGWAALSSQVSQCKLASIPYVLLDSTEMRNHPEAVLNPLFERLGLTFSSDLLRWKAASSLRLGSLDGEQDQWYEHVLRSQGLQPESRTPRQAVSFPTRNGFRKHVLQSLEIYHALRNDDQMITTGSGQ